MDLISLVVDPLRMMIAIASVLVSILLGIALIGFLIWGVVLGTQNLLIDLEPHAGFTLWGDIIIDILTIIVLVVFILVKIGILINFLGGGLNYV